MAFPVTIVKRQAKDVMAAILFMLLDDKNRNILKNRIYEKTKVVDYWWEINEYENVRVTIICTADLLSEDIVVIGF